MFALPAIALLLAGAPSVQTVVVRGEAEVAVPPLIERKFVDQVASISVAHVPDKKDEWRLTYDHYGHRCSLLGRGSADNIRIVPNQRCRVRIDEAELRGSCTSIVDRGSLVKNPKTGVTQLDLRGRVDADVERFVAITVLGRTFQRWVPVPTPEGEARFTGRTVAD